MDYHSIKEIIRKFWLGETSLEEENTLKKYFLYNQNPPEEFQTAADYFAAIEADNRMELSDDFDQEMMGKIIAMEKKSGNIQSSRKWIPYLIAASIALLVGITIINKLQDTDNPINVEPVAVTEEFIDTYDDPETAYENVRAALMMVSSNLNEGVSYTSELNKFEQAQKEISKTKK